TKLCLSCELQSVLGLALHVAKWISEGEKKRDQTVAGIDRIFEVAGLLRRDEGAPQQFDTGAQVPWPGIDKITEALEDASPETLQHAILHQIKAENAEAQRGLPIAEAR